VLDAVTGMWLDSDMSTTTTTDTIKALARQMQRHNGACDYRGVVIESSTLRCEGPDQNGHGTGHSVSVFVPMMAHLLGSRVTLRLSSLRAAVAAVDAVLDSEDRQS
jgi:hypothetical protein